MLVQDFYNKVLSELDKIYFPNVKYYMDDKKCAKLHYTTELFNNGCLDYETYIKRISKLCGDSETKIKEIVDKYIL
jgi:hypothetical protein